MVIVIRKCIIMFACQILLCFYLLLSPIVVFLCTDDTPITILYHMQWTLKDFDIFLVFLWEVFSKSIATVQFSLFETNNLNNHIYYDEYTQRIKFINSIRNLYTKCIFF